MVSRSCQLIIFTGYSSDQIKHHIHTMEIKHSAKKGAAGSSVADHNGFRMFDISSIFKQAILCMLNSEENTSNTNLKTRTPYTGKYFSVMTKTAWKKAIWELGGDEQEALHFRQGFLSAITDGNLVDHRGLRPNSRTMILRTFKQFPDPPFVRELVLQLRQSSWVVDYSLYDLERHQCP